MRAQGTLYGRWWVFVKSTSDCFCFPSEIKRKVVN